MAGYLGLIQYSVSIFKEYLGITCGLTPLIKDYIQFDSIQTIQV